MVTKEIHLYVPVTAFLYGKVAKEIQRGLCPIHGRACGSLSVRGHMPLDFTIKFCLVSNPSVDWS